MKHNLCVCMCIVGKLRGVYNENFRIAFELRFFDRRPHTIIGTTVSHCICINLRTAVKVRKIVSKFSVMLPRSSCQRNWADVHLHSSTTLVSALELVTCIIKATRTAHTYTPKMSQHLYADKQSTFSLRAPFEVLFAELNCISNRANAKHDPDVMSRFVYIRVCKCF